MNLQRDEHIPHKQANTRHLIAVYGCTAKFFKTYLTDVIRYSLISDVISRVICIWNKVEYLKKKESYRNSIKEAIFSF